MRPAAWFVALFAVATPAAWSTPAAPVAASPGSVSGVSLVEARCPTFSWGQVERARSYELVVYRVGEEGRAARPALRQNLPGSLGSWTPALDRCLERGQRYGWAVRAHSARAQSPWSETLLFEVASQPAALQVEEALAVLREYVATPAAQAPEGAAAVTGRITARAEEAAPAGSAAVEPRVVPTTTGLQLGLGAYQGGTAGSVVAGHKKQMIIGGEYNTGPNVGSSVKLLISDYDNQTGGGSDIYTIYVEDENNLVDFYVRKQEKKSSAYFAGGVGIGTTPDIAIPLHVEGGTDATPASGGYLVVGPTDGYNLALDGNEIMARNNAATSTLYLNNNGGDVVVGDDLAVNGVLDIEYEIVEAIAVDSRATASCSAGKKVLGGGCSYAGTGRVDVSAPLDSEDGWLCGSLDGSSGAWIVRAICANLGDS